MCLGLFIAFTGIVIYNKAKIIFYLVLIFGIVNYLTIYGYFSSINSNSIFSQISSVILVLVLITSAYAVRKLVLPVLSLLISYD